MTATVSIPFKPIPINLDFISDWSTPVKSPKFPMSPISARNQQVSVDPINLQHWDLNNFYRNQQYYNTSNQSPASARNQQVSVDPIRLQHRDLNNFYRNQQYYNTSNQSPASARNQQAATQEPQPPKPDDFQKQLLGFAQQVFNDQQARNTTARNAQVRAQQQAAAQAKQMGYYINNAINQQNQGVKRSQSMIESIMNQSLSDPGFKAAQNFALQRANSAGIAAPASLQRLEQLAMSAPMGLDPKGLQTILGNLGRRSAAMGTGAMRSIASRAAGLGVSGPALQSAMSQERLGRGSALNSAMANSELDWQLKNFDARSQAMNQLATAAGMMSNHNQYNENNRINAQNQLAAISGMKYGLPLQAAGMYSNSVSANNPLDWLAKAQGLTAPLSALPASQVAGSTAQPTDMTGLLSLMMGALGGKSGPASTYIRD